MTESKKILIIDDDPDAIAYLKAVLEDNGYETMSACDGEEGITKARETPPVIILLDLMMPNKSGIKFLNEVKSDEQLKEVPIVVISGARQETGVDMKQYLEHRPFQERKIAVADVDVDSSPDVFLEKPVNPPELLTAVKKLV